MDQPLDVRIQEGVVDARFRDRRMLGGEEMEAGCNQLLQTIATTSCTRINLSLRRIKHISSACLGKLITLHKNLRSRQIQFSLVEVNARVFELFAATGLNKAFDIQNDEDDEAEDDLDDGQAGVPSRLIRPKPSGGSSKKLPPPSPESA